MWLCLYNSLVHIYVICVCMCVCVCGRVCVRGSASQCLHVVTHAQENKKMFTIANVWVFCCGFFLWQKFKLFLHFNISQAGCPCGGREDFLHYIRLRRLLPLGVEILKPTVLMELIQSRSGNLLAKGLLAWNS